MDEHIKEVFHKAIGPESFHRVDTVHILDIYLGLDQYSHYTLFLISEVDVPKIVSSKLIHVEIKRRKDKKWGITFSLEDEKYVDMFCIFCEDIIESSRPIADKNKGTAFICSRYKEWQQMLKKNPDGLLSVSEIKGLIGELLFLHTFLIEKYGEEKAVNSWIGPDRADQDFVFEDIWYEVKSTVSGAESVIISSVEQLDVNKPGELVVMYLDKTSQADSEKISLNIIVQKILNQLHSEKVKSHFNSILSSHGYLYLKEYDEVVYKYSKMVEYIVTKLFPSLKRKNIPDTVVNARYELSLAAIADHKKRSN